MSCTGQLWFVWDGGHECERQRSSDWECLLGLPFLPNKNPAGLWCQLHQQQLRPELKSHTLYIEVHSDSSSLVPWGEPQHARVRPMLRYGYILPRPGCVPRKRLPVPFPRQPTCIEVWDMSLPVPWGQPQHARVGICMIYNLVYMYMARQHASRAA